MSKIEESSSALIPLKGIWEIVLLEHENTIGDNRSTEKTDNGTTDFFDDATFKSVFQS